MEKSHGLVSCHHRLNEKEEHFRVKADVSLLESHELFTFVRKIH